MMFARKGGEKQENEARQRAIYRKTDSRVIRFCWTWMEHDVDVS
jgi:hypothetical protein